LLRIEVLYSWKAPYHLRAWRMSFTFGKNSVLSRRHNINVYEKMQNRWQQYG